METQPRFRSVREELKSDALDALMRLIVNRDPNSRDGKRRKRSQ